MSGCDNAAPIQDVYVAVRNEFGRGPAFWLRYFNPSPAADLLENDAVSEGVGCWNSGARAIGCISAPSQSRLSGSSAEGLADAQSFAAAMLSAYHAIHPLLTPTNNKLYCWLDQEYGTSLSLSYWDGWASYLAKYNFGSLGTYPLHPCVYCTPSSPYPNCSTFAKTTGVNVPAAVWTPVPESCHGLSNPPTWAAEQCSSYSSSKVPTKLWQYAEQGVCGWSAAVDLDVGATGFNTPDYCFRLTADP